jgi:hypothetical protein
VIRVSPTTIGSAEVFSSRMKSDNWGILFGLSDLLRGCDRSNQAILYRSMKSHTVTIG